jgi:hypothetical protein
VVDFENDGWVSVVADGHSFAEIIGGWHKMKGIPIPVHGFLTRSEMGQKPMRTHQIGTTISVHTKQPW